MIIVDTTEMKKDGDNVPTDEYNTLRDKYNRLQDQFNEVLKHNQELEDKLLTFVDKSEFEKLRLSHEIDDLSEKLQLANYNISNLHGDCARYKADCMLAVHLLQCQPSQYVSQKLGSATQSVANNIVNSVASAGSDHTQKRAVHVTSFPPMAIVFDHDVVNTDSLTTSTASLTNGASDRELNEDQTDLMTTAGSQTKKDSLRDLFIEKIAKEPLYSGTVQVHQCLNCGKSVQVEDRQTQTSFAGDLICFQDESTDQLCAQPCVHSMKRMGNWKKRCDSGDSLASNETEY